MCNLSLIIGETNVQPKSSFCINPSLTSMKVIQPILFSFSFFTIMLCM